MLNKCVLPLKNNYATSLFTTTNLSGTHRLSLCSPGSVEEHYGIAGGRRIFPSRPLINSKQYFDALGKSISIP